MGSSTGVRSLEHTPLNASLFMTAPRVAARTFQDLVVWRKAHELVLAVYSFTAGFPETESYGFALQNRPIRFPGSGNNAERIPLAWEVESVGRRTVEDALQSK